MSEFSTRDIKIQLRWDWLVVSYILHFASFVLILYTWNTSGGESTKGGAETLALTMTAIEIMLAILAIFLGVIAFGGFWMIRREAVSAAEDAAVKEINRLNSQQQLNLGSGTEASDPRQPAQTIDFESAKEVRTDKDDDGS